MKVAWSEGRRASRRRVAAPLVPGGWRGRHKRGVLVLAQTWCFGIKVTVEVEWNCGVREDMQVLVGLCGALSCFSELSMTVLPPGPREQLSVAVTMRARVWRPRYRYTYQAQDRIVSGADPLVLRSLCTLRAEADRHRGRTPERLCKFACMLHVLARVCVGKGFSLALTPGSNCAQHQVTVRCCVVSVVVGIRGPGSQAGLGANWSQSDCSFCNILCCHWITVQTPQCYSIACPLLWDTCTRGVLGPWRN